MKVESVAHAFETYRRAVIPAAAPAVQVEECRRAFYAGSYALLMNVAYHIGDESTPEDEGIRQLEALKAECETFVKNLRQEPDRPTPVEQIPSRLPTATRESYTHDERYQVRNADIERALRTIGTLIDGEVPEGWAWGLFLVPFGNNAAAPKGAGAVFWISNGDRAGMMDAVKGWLDDNERRQKRG